MPDIRGCLLEEISRIFVEGMITFYQLKLAVLITRTQKITREKWTIFTEKAWVHSILVLQVLNLPQTIFTDTKYPPN